MKKRWLIKCDVKNLKAKKVKFANVVKKDQRICVFHYSSRNISRNSTRARSKRDSWTWEIWVKCKVYEPNQLVYICIEIFSFLRSSIHYATCSHDRYDCVPITICKIFIQYGSNSLSPLLLLFYRERTIKRNDTRIKRNMTR